MASIDLKTATTSLQMEGDGTPITALFPTTTNAGANVSLSGVGSLSLLMVPQGFPLNSTITLTAATPVVVSATSGSLVLSLATASSTPTGSYRYEIIGTPSGGSPQTIAQGTVVVI